MPLGGAAGFAWLLAAVCVGAVAYIALASFPGAPLPGEESVNYFPDYPRWIAIAADAKHHWPIEEPSVAGEPLPYHYFVYVHMAAASQVTGLDLPVVLLRLFILPLAVLLVLQLVVAGRSFARSAYAGLIAACLAFFIGPRGAHPVCGRLFHLDVLEPELSLRISHVRTFDNPDR